MKNHDLTRSQVEALAYMFITNSDKHLRFTTYCATSKYISREFTQTYDEKLDLTLGHLEYVLTEEGRAVMETSKTWKAHQYLTEQGFKIRSFYTGHKPSYLSYLKGSPVGFSVDAFQSSGSVYVKRPRSWKMDLIDLKNFTPKAA